MNQLIWKNKLVVLWLFQLFNFIAVIIVPYSFTIVSTQIGPGTGALIVFYIFLTCLMIWLTLVLEPRISRWLIMLVALFYALVKVQWTIQGLSGGYAVEFVFNEIWGLAAALMLLWYAWKAPRVEVA